MRFVSILLGIRNYELRVSARGLKEERVLRELPMTTKYRSMELIQWKWSFFKKFSDAVLITKNEAGKRKAFQELEAE